MAWKYISCNRRCYVLNYTYRCTMSSKSVVKALATCLVGGTASYSPMALSDESQYPLPARSEQRAASVTARGGQLLLSRPMGLLATLKTPPLTETSGLGTEYTYLHVQPHLDTPSSVSSKIRIEVRPLARAVKEQGDSNPVELVSLRPIDGQDLLRQSAIESAASGGRATGLRALRASEP